ncbi:site-specific integrase [Roseibium sp. CAU 1637]|uniref:Site-specific integrase n=1 Tax=Roseibium limicola TaxID=2816037 RepID=A0A939J5B3_9HYPH|nr:site-specific integrase [Roseibium limicola]MBO0343897.1 site-specific integrase [Roseibium limicola]
MARASYIQRRDGRYHLQIRLSKSLGHMLGKSTYRKSLGTSQYGVAQYRLRECLGWIYSMNESTDYPHLIEMNLFTLREYVSDTWPLSDERLFSRRTYEEMFKNFKHRAIAAGFDPTVYAPDINALFAAFVQQNLDAEAHEQNIIRQQHYERGRQDALSSMANASAPSSFQMNMPVVGFATSESLEMETQGNDMGSESAPDEQQFQHGHQSLLPSSSGGVTLQSKTSHPELVKQAKPVRFSNALSRFLDETGGNKDAKSTTRLIVNFLIDKLNDPIVADFDAEAVRTLDRMIPDIPNKKGVPGVHSTSLAARHDYAQQFGWDNLTRLTAARIQNGYHNELSKFFGWMIDEGIYPHEKPVFKTLSPKNLVSISRDAFDDDEVTRIFAQPLFTGCSSVKRIWRPGDYLIQNHLYWAYLILLLTGTRPGELGQLDLNDIQERDGISYLFLRPFDPRNGQVALEDVKRFKTESSQRVIPLHPLLFDLGLQERIEELREIDCPVLFPEWEPYPKPDGEIRWGQPITKSWQYLKKNIEIDRSDVTLYSTRHWFADLIDNTDIKHATRTRVMGHKNKDDIPSRYGSKSRLTTRDLELLTDIRSPVIDKISGPLIAAKALADQGKLKVVKPWLQQTNWSKYYRNKFLGKSAGKASLP